MNGPHDPNGSYYPMAGPGPSSQANAQASAPSPPMPSGPFVQPHQDLQEFLQSFWTRQMEVAEREQPDFKTYPLPLARIKKVMKSDEDVKMISAEAPILFSRACEIFISELTCRAWLIAESHKRRTLQKSDVAAAIAFSDMFDFLIDVVPREEPAPAASAPQSTTGPAPQPQQLIQQHQQQQQQQQQMLTQTNPHLNAFDQGPVGHEPMFGTSHVGQPEDEALYRDFILDGEGA